MNVLDILTQTTKEGAFRSLYRGRAPALLQEKRQDSSGR